uniref:ATP-dependent Clp protease proteolytic subunit 1 n=1 Tax=Hypericum monogynum TaxID=684760 RepID=UPI0022A7753F|nr:ATP-dependent Clp protease proteolytic subunit 1 [Hypericum monogynum]UZS76719.1 ATP-dependent Clp protease proteolytic subunit 1 [Hypericum monogynum]
MSLGVPHVPFYDPLYDSEDEFEDKNFSSDYYSDVDDPELKAFRARKEEDDRDFQDSLDFEALHRQRREEDHGYKGWAEEYFAGKKRKLEEEEEEESDEEWVELPTIFYDAGVLFVFGKIDNEVANNLISSILLLNDEKENIDELTFFINSPGGFLKSGLAIFDIMHSCDLDLGLNTVGLGLVASTASLILSAGDLNYRWAFQHTRVMMHQPTGQFRPKSEEIKKLDKRLPKLPKLPTGNNIHEFNSYIDELLDLRRRIIDVYAFTTQKDPGVISRDIERDFFMSAEGAKVYGIIDHVLPNREDSRGTESDEEDLEKEDLEKE